MDSFYWIVLAIAVVFLIIGLTATSMMLRHEDEEAVFPKSHAPCPDGWKQKDGKCYLKDERTTGLEFANTFDSKNYGTQTGTDFKYLLLSMPTGVTGNDVFYLLSNTGIEVDNSDYGCVTFNPDATICQKKAWADHHKIRWDGITNYNNC